MLVSTIEISYFGLGLKLIGFVNAHVVCTQLITSKTPRSLELNILKAFNTTFVSNHLRFLLQLKHFTTTNQYETFAPSKWIFTSVIVSKSAASNRCSPKLVTLLYREIILLINVCYWRRLKDSTFLLLLLQVMIDNFWKTENRKYFSRHVIS